MATTSAEVTDAEGLSHVCPRGGAMFGDKGYCVRPAQRTLKRKGCHDATIKKNNMRGKNHRKDGWISTTCALPKFRESAVSGRHSSTGFQRQESGGHRY